MKPEITDAILERASGLASELETGLLVYVFHIKGQKEPKILSPAMTELFATNGRLCKCGTCHNCFVMAAINQMEDYFPHDRELDQAWMERWHK